MQTIQTLLQTAADQLRHHVDQPRLEAEVLLAFVMQKDRSHFYMHPEESVPATLCAHYQALVTQRLTGVPVAYLTQVREFWSLPLKVNANTLIPRPETELLVELALALLPHHPPATVVDLGTGSGAIALAIASERPQWQIIATDVSQNALAIASKNAQQLALDQVSFYQGNWCTALPEIAADMIISNPPYLTEGEWQARYANLCHEPKSALVAANEGLADYAAIIAEVSAFLKPKGYLVFEHGWQQAAALHKLLADAGFVEITTKQDLAGLDRVTFGRRVP